MIIAFNEWETEKTDGTRFSSRGDALRTPRGAKSKKGGGLTDGEGDHERGEKNGGMNFQTPEGAAPARRTGNRCMGYGKTQVPLARAKGKEKKTNHSSELGASRR